MWVEIKEQENGLFMLLNKKTGAEYFNLTLKDVIAKLRYEGDK